jgi:hypothetical protein
VEPKTTPKATPATTPKATPAKAPKAATKATRATGTKATPKAAKATPKATTRATPAKAATKAAKAPTKAATKATPKATGPRLTGPTPERVALAKRVAKLRAEGAKWNEIATATGKAEGTLAKLRSDVRAGVFAKLSPVANRVPASGKGSF